VQTGDVVYQESDASYDFFVIEFDAVAIVAAYGIDDRVIAGHGPHRFLGERSLLTGGGVLLTAVVCDPGEVIQVPLARLREFMAQDDELAKLIFGACLARRAILVELGAGIRVVGWTATEDAVRVREFLTRNRLRSGERCRDAVAATGAPQAQIAAGRRRRSRASRCAQAATPPFRLAAR
jgi:thioredoxin reductase (NADPH)